MKREKLLELKKYIEEFKVNKMLMVGEGSFIKINSYLCYINNGRVIRRDKIVKKSNDGSAVVIMPVTSGGEIITVIEPRVFTELGVGVGFVSGYIEKGEDSISAGSRELLEETGYASDDIILLDSFYQDEGCSSALIYSLIAFDSKKVGEQHFDSSEMIKYMSFTYEEILELEEMGYIAGASSKLTLCKAKKYMEGI